MHRPDSINPERSALALTRNRPAIRIGAAAFRNPEAGSRLARYPPRSTLGGDSRLRFGRWRQPCRPAEKTAPGCSPGAVSLCYVQATLTRQLPPTLVQAALVASLCLVPLQAGPAAREAILIREVARYLRKERRHTAPGPHRRVGRQGHSRRSQIRSCNTAACCTTQYCSSTVGSKCSATALPPRPPTTAPTAAPTTVPIGPAAIVPAAAPAAMPPAAAPMPTPTGWAPGAPVIGSGLVPGCLISLLSMIVSSEP